MPVKKKTRDRGPIVLRKVPSGIRGLDDILGGGLPEGRTALVCGQAGCGKTVLGMEFLVRGATLFNEPGLFVAFEETGREMTENFAALGFDLGALERRNLLAIDTVSVENHQIEEAGDYDLEGLFIRIRSAIESIGAKRVVLDTIESLFAVFTNEAILRSELRRLFRFVKDCGVTAIVTAECGSNQLSRHGIEEYVADCVISLDNRVIEEVTTRRLRVVKYRGSAHATNEFPFLINNGGISVMPVTSLGLMHDAHSEQMSSGIATLDEMLGGGGFFRASSILVSGAAGTGKTSISCSFASGGCERGERCLYFAFEESPAQIMRNMRSIGVDMKKWVDQGRLRFVAERSTMGGLESHLLRLHDAVTEFKPTMVVIDPISNLIQVGTKSEVRVMLSRLLDMLKMLDITCMATSLVLNVEGIEDSGAGISSLMDVWIDLRNLEQNAERNRALYILKARGQEHSNQVREFIISSQGIKLVDVYVGPEGVLTGSARLAMQESEQEAVRWRALQAKRRHKDFERRAKTLEAQIAAMRADFAWEKQEAIMADEQQRMLEEGPVERRLESARQRTAERHGPARQRRRKRLPQ